MIRILAVVWILTLFSARAWAENLRIISLAPSLTETVHVLGASEQLVGVSQFCTYPKQIKNLPKVGALFSPNFEMMISLKPDVVLILEDHAGLSRKLDQLGLRSVSVKNESIADIRNSITTIGEAIGRGKESARVNQEIQHALNAYRSGPSDPKNVMLVIESTIKGGQVSSAIVAGNASFYQDVLSKIGAKNVVESSIRYPKISAEFFYEKNIDTVVLLFPENFTGEDELRKAWKKTLKGRETKITSIKNNLVLTPGPRVLAILDIIAEQVYGSAPYAVD